MESLILNRSAFSWLVAWSKPGILELTRELKAKGEETLGV